MKLTMHSGNPGHPEPNNPNRPADRNIQNSNAQNPRPVTARLGPPRPSSSVPHPAGTDPANMRTVHVTRDGTPPANPYQAAARSTFPPFEDPPGRRAYTSWTASPQSADTGQQDGAPARPLQPTRHRFGPALADSWTPPRPSLPGRYEPARMAAGILRDIATMTRFYAAQYAERALKPAAKAPGSPGGPPDAPRNEATPEQD